MKSIIVINNNTSSEISHLQDDTKFLSNEPETVMTVKYYLISSKIPSCRTVLISIQALIETACLENVFPQRTSPPCIAKSKTEAAL